MLGVPQFGDTRIVTNLGNVGTLTPGTSVTTGAASTTKGTVVEIISAANNVQDSWGIYVQAAAYAVAAGTSEGCMDILIGGATDDILIPDLLMGFCGSGGAGGLKSWFFPIAIPAGVRIAAQAAGIRLSTAMRVGVKLYGGSTPPFRVGSRVTTYGMGTVPNGTSITPGASGAQGSYTQMTASSSADHFAFMPSLQVVNDTTVNDRNYNVGLGVGSATEELIGEWQYGTDGNEAMKGPYDCMPVFRSVRSGTRLALRVSNSGTNDAGYNAVLHAVS